LLQVILKTLSDVTNISVLVLIFVFSYMLIGLELFAYRLQGDSKEELFKDPLSHRSKFDTFVESFFSVFLILVGDGWTQMYHDFYLNQSPWVSTVYFHSLIIVGQFILLNLFISVLIENFEQLSVRNDIVLKLTDVRTKTFKDRFIEFFCTCKKKNKIVDEKKRSKV
jgi:hypothetical protein